MQSSISLSQFKNYSSDGYGFFGFLLLVWLILPNIIRQLDRNSGAIDPSIWLLILLGLIAFMMISALCWWLLKKSWGSLNLPALDVMVVQFKHMELWQQLGFYWASFALLLLAGSICLSAIC